MEISANYYQVLQDILEVDEVDDSQQFEEFEEWDSLSALSVVASIGETFGIVISSTILKEYNTIGKLKAYLEDKLSK
jgi:acyl carrier protein